jgi:hypothetical protein
MVSWPNSKDPDDTINCSVRWKIYGDNVVGSEWEVPDPLLKEGENLTNNVASVILSGGQIQDRFYQLKNKVTTSNGQELERTITLIMANH